MKKYLVLGSIVFGLTLYTYAQNIGVNVPNPVRAKFEVNGVAGSGATSGIFGGESTGISLQRNWPTIGFNQYRDLVTPGSQGKYMSNGYAAIQYLSPVNGTMVFDMFPSGTGGNTTPAAISSLLLFANGNVGVQSAANDATLHVARSSSVSSAVIEGTNYNSFFNNTSLEYTFIHAGKAGGKVFIDDIPQGIVSLGSADGVVGLNTGVPITTFDIKQAQIGGIETGLSLLDDASDRWEILNDGELFFKFDGVAKAEIHTDGSYEQLSDMRMKKNILDMPVMLPAVCQLRPVNYHLKKDALSAATHFGFIAQDVEKIFPALIDTISNEKSGSSFPDMRMMDNIGFLVIAIKSIQEQQKIIDELTEEVNALQAKQGAGSRGQKHKKQ